MAQVDVVQELQDMVLNHVLFIQPRTVTITSTTGHKPPFQLQISAATRGKVAKQYYRTSTFTIIWNLENCRNLAPRWLRSLTVEHRDEIADLRIDNAAITPTSFLQLYGHPGDLPAMEADRRIVASHVKNIRDLLRNVHQIHLRDGVFKTNYVRVVNLTSERLADIEIFEIWASESGEPVNTRGSR